MQNLALGNVIPGRNPNTDKILCTKKLLTLYVYRKRHSYVSAVGNSEISSSRCTHAMLCGY